MLRTGRRPRGSAGGIASLGNDAPATDPDLLSSLNMNTQPLLLHEWAGTSKGVNKSVEVRLSKAFDV